MSRTKRALLVLPLCTLFLSLPVYMNAQEAEPPETVPEEEEIPDPVETPESATKEPAPKKNTSGITFYIPAYTPDSMTFFMSEYQNALANQKKANWYLTLFVTTYMIYDAFDEELEDVSELPDEYQFWAKSRRMPNMLMLAASTGFTFPIWRNDKEHYWSLIGHATVVTDSMLGVAESVNFFGGGGLRADYGIVSLGFLFGGYVGVYKADFKYINNSRGWEAQTVGMENLSKFTVPISFGLSKQTIFIDRIIGNFGFNNDFSLNQLFSEIAFTTLSIGAAELGVNVYYKSEDYNILARQQRIGAAFTTKRVQFDGGYRFFSMKQNSAGVTFDDGPYGRIIVKIGGLAFSLNVELSGKGTTGYAFGIGFAVGGGVWTTLAELGFPKMTSISHVNLRPNK